VTFVTSDCTASQAFTAARFQRGAHVSPAVWMRSPVPGFERVALGGVPQADLSTVAFAAVSLSMPAMVVVALVAAQLGLVVDLVVVVGLIGLIRVVIPTTGCGPPS
jgi:hypothetical protein